MIRQQIVSFVFRWVLSSVGMWSIINLYASTDSSISLGIYILAGFVFSLVNAIVKPLISTLVLPLIAIFLIVAVFLINSLMVFITIKIVPHVGIDFKGAMAASIIMSITNGVVNFFTRPYTNK